MQLVLECRYLLKHLLMGYLVRGDMIGFEVNVEHFKVNSLLLINHNVVTSDESILAVGLNIPRDCEGVAWYVVFKE